MGERVAVEALLRDPTPAEVSEGLERNPGSRRLADRSWRPLWFELRVAVGDQQDHAFVHSLVWCEAWMTPMRVRPHAIACTMRSV